MKPRMMVLKAILGTALLACLLLSCGGDNGPVQPPTTGGPPTIVGLRIVPDVICVGGSADVTFTLADPDPQMINWNAILSSTLHGTLSVSNGAVSSGSSVTIRFKAANSGRHRHRVSLRVTATDADGQQAEPAVIELFVFNC